MWIYRLKFMLALTLVFVFVQVKAVDENNLDEVVQKTKEMYEAGIDKRKIAEWVTKVVDDRVYCSNNSEALLRPIWSAIQVTRVRWDDDKKGEYHEAAPDAWDIGYGNCQENSAIAYYILKKAGVNENVRVLRTKSHSFCVWDLPPTAQTNDPETWGDAMIVDPWWNGVLDGTEAETNGWFRNGDPKNRVSDDTKEIDLMADSWQLIQKREEHRTGQKIEQEDPLAGLEDCFIATAVYGTPLNEEIQILRNYRENYLRENFLGRIFISTYEVVGPVAASYINRSESRKDWARKNLVKPALELAEKHQNINPENQ